MNRLEERYWRSQDPAGLRLMSMSLARACALQSRSSGRLWPSMRNPRGECDRDLREVQEPMRRRGNLGNTFLGGLSHFRLLPGIRSPRRMRLYNGEDRLSLHNL